MNMKLFAAFDDKIGQPGDLGLFNTTIGETVPRVLAGVFAAGAAVAIGFVLFGAAKYVLSGGDSAGIKNAKETIIYAIVGLAVTLVAFGVVSLVTGNVK
jgi:hypothetical protein